jgi:ribosome-associated toxin RatA of RatAB toxin-antitoxin module
MRFLPFFRFAVAVESPAGGAACTLALLLGLLLLHPAAAQGANAFSVNATRYGDAVQVNVRATLRAPLALIWNTLTDYDHLAEFIPGMSKSRLLQRQGNTATIEQSGYAHLWFFRSAIEVTVEAVEQPDSAIQVRLLKGNLKRLEGGYQIEKIGDNNYALSWSGIIEPGVAMPGFIATPLMRKNISEQFLGMVDEIERRAALLPPAASN